MLSPKTTAGGQALLQKAITLDSMGRSEDALSIYRQLRKHRCLEVAKTVCRCPSCTRPCDNHCMHPQLPCGYCDGKSDCNSCQSTQFQALPWYPTAYVSSVSSVQYVTSRSALLSCTPGWMVHGPMSTNFLAPMLQARRMSYGFRAGARCLLLTCSSKRNS